MDSHKLRHFAKHRTTSTALLSSGFSPASSSIAMQPGSDAQWTTQPHKTRGMAGARNRSTISKDKIQGDEQRMSDLLAQHGNKVMRSQHVALNADKAHPIPNPIPNPSVEEVSIPSYESAIREVEAEEYHGLPVNMENFKPTESVVSTKGDDSESDHDPEMIEYPKRGKTRIPERPLIDGVKQPERYAYSFSNNSRLSMPVRDNAYSDSAGFAHYAGVETSKAYEYDDDIQRILPQKPRGEYSWA
ncbi:hypothetical protein GGI42DRAFT_309768 [Trichoderma sp. SZMC 28013]